MALRLQSEPEWKTFFLAAGIPDTESSNYAKSFSDNRITETILDTLDKNVLIELQVTVIGDCINILRHAKTLIPQTPAVKPSVKSTIALPTISPDMTHPQYRKFRIDWDVYKNLTALPQDQLAHHIYNACDSTVQTALINTFPSFLSTNEKTLLDTIECIVTKQANPAVHRLQFTSLKQHEHETIQEFAICLRSAAVDCAYTCPNCDHDLSPINIRDQFICGLANEKLQKDLLVRANLLQTLDDTMKHASTYEAALRDQLSLTEPESVYSNRLSSYKQQTRTKGKLPSTNPQPTTKPCAGCGSSQHGAPGMNDRPSKCPAWGKTCRTCKKMNHFAQVCGQTQPIRSVDVIAHVRYDNTRQEYTNTDVNDEEIPCLLTPMIPSPHAISLPIFPDTGASICIAGVIKYRFT